MAFSTASRQSFSQPPPRRRTGAVTVNLSVQSLTDVATDRADFELRLRQSGELLRSTQFSTLRPLLPLMLNLRGKPYTIKDHFPFEPLFRTRMPQRLLFMTGRQLGKSSAFSAQAVVKSNCIDYFSTLCITPLFEQVRRFSNNYVRPFIEQSPIKQLMMDSTTENSVLQRSFKNFSKIIFSFAGLDADRARGISADELDIDETQDIDFDLLAVLRETMSHSPWRLERYAGTPKTLDNAMEYLWRQSSMAEWCTKCQHPGCGHWNIPSMEHDLLKMIGPFRADISRDAPGVICAKCAKPITPHTGRWVHARPSLKLDFEGYHIPQIVLPLHYASPNPLT